MGGVGISLDLDIEIVGQHGDRVGVLPIDGPVTVDDLAGGLEKALGIAAF
jgi:hypothetical protein